MTIAPAQLAGMKSEKQLQPDFSKIAKNPNRTQRDRLTKVRVQQYERDGAGAAGQDVIREEAHVNCCEPVVVDPARDRGEARQEHEPPPVPPHAMDHHLELGVGAHVRFHLVAQERPVENRAGDGKRTDVRLM
jgi:hypothetical protein